MLTSNIDYLNQYGGSCGMPSNMSADAPYNSSSKNNDFVIKLTNYYANKTQSGGYTGRRVIGGYQSDKELTESGANDSFVTKNKNKMLNEMKNNKDSEELYTEYSDNDDAIESDSDDIDVDTPNLDLTDNRDFTNNRTSHDARLAVNNPTGSRARNNNNMNRVKRFEDEWATEDFDLNTVNNHNVDDSDNIDADEAADLDDVNTSDIDTDFINRNLGNERTNVTNTSNERESDFNDDDDEADEDEDNDLGANDEDDDDDEDDQDETSYKPVDDYDDFSNDRVKRNSRLRAADNRRPRRERDAKVDEIYRNFLQQLMDKLGINEETARTYRSAIKILIERDSPELKGFENDALKVKKMEEIFGDDKQFKALIKRVEVELPEIKKFMEERRKEAEKRKKEWEERRKSQGKHAPRTSSDKPATSETPKEKPKRKTKSKVGEAGYLESDEVIFSP